MATPIPPPSDVEHLPQRWDRAVTIYLEQTRVPRDMAARYLPTLTTPPGEPTQVLDAVCPGCARSQDCTPLHGGELDEPCGGCGYLCPIADQVIIDSGEPIPEMRFHPLDGPLCLVRVERGRRTIAEEHPPVDGQDTLL